MDSLEFVWRHQRRLPTQRPTHRSAGCCEQVLTLHERVVKLDASPRIPFCIKLFIMFRHYKAESCQKVSESGKKTRISNSNFNYCMKPYLFQKHYIFIEQTSFSESAQIFWDSMYRSAPSSWPSSASCVSLQHLLKLRHSFRSDVTSPLAWRRLVAVVTFQLWPASFSRWKHLRAWVRCDAVAPEATFMQIWVEINRFCFENAIKVAISKLNCAVVDAVIACARCRSGVSLHC